MNAQPLLTGLADQKVYLTGTLDNPVVDNQSGKDILGYVLVKTSDTGITVDVSTALNVRSWARGESPLAQIKSGLREVHRDGTPVIPTKVILDSVIFSDGEFVGPDMGKSFELLGWRWGATRQFGSTSQMNPSQIEAAAQDARGRRLQLPAILTHKERQIAQATDFTAEMLYQIQEESNLDAAITAAGRLSRMPQLWKGEKK